MKTAQPVRTDDRLLLARSLCSWSASDQQAIEIPNHERTHSGIARAKAAGKRFGRPPALNEEQRQAVIIRLKAGDSISAVARQFSTTRQTIHRIKAASSFC